MAVVADAAQMQNLLQVILTTLDNSERREAETIVVRSVKNPASAALLVQLIQSDEVGSGVRHLAAILLRKKLFSLWRALPLENQELLKGILLDRLGKEPVKMVRFAVAHVVSILAKAEMRDHHRWPQLEAAIGGAMQSPIPELRELSMVLVYAIAEVFGEDRDGALVQTIGPALLAGLQDPEIRVRIAALKSVSVVLPFLHGNRAAKEQLLSNVVPMCGVIIREGILRDDASTLLLRTMDLVEQLCEDLHTAKHRDHLLFLFNVCIQVMSTRAAPHTRIREHASDILALLCQSKPKFIKECGLIESIVESCLTVMSEDDSISLPFEYDEEQDEMDDDDVDLLNVRTPCMFASKLLNVAVCHLPSKLVRSAIMAKVGGVLESQPSGDNPRQRKAAIIGVACLAEGDSGYLRRRTTYLLSIAQKKKTTTK